MSDDAAELLPGEDHTPWTWAVEVAPRLTLPLLAALVAVSSVASVLYLYEGGTDDWTVNLLTVVVGGTLLYTLAVMALGVLTGED